MTDRYLPALIAAGVPPTLHAEAVECFESAMRPALLRFALGLTAPSAWLLIGALLPRKAEALPRWLRWYDNNINLNGDRSGWAIDQDGKHYRLPAPDHDVVFEDGTHLSYWAPHSPRSFLPRWNFNGWRNRCAWLAKHWGREAGIAWRDDGVPINVRTWTSAGRLLADASEYRAVVHECNGIWQLEITERAKNGGVITRSYGFEIANCNQIDSVATVTWTPWSWKRR